MKGTSMATSAHLLIICLAAQALAADITIHPDKANSIPVPASEARYVRMAILANSGAQPCIDELEVYGPDDKANLALASSGAKATASSCLAGYDAHRIAHLNDGLYGNDHSWIAAGASGEWVQIELPRPMTVNRVVFSRDRTGRFSDRVIAHFEILLSLDGGLTFNSTLANPFMALSFLALPVIPELKLTDLGLVDVSSFSFVSLFEAGQ